MKYLIHSCFCFFLFVTPGFAQSLDDAKALYEEGKYAESLPVFERIIQSSPKNVSYNQWYGTCLLETGAIEKARPYLEYASERKMTEAFRSLGKLYYLSYNFEESAASYRRYKEALMKAKKLPEAEAVDFFIHRSEKASRMLSRCENIQIIDSIVADKRTFSDTYLLSSESGSLQMQNNEIVYLNPLQSKRFYAQQENDGSRRLYSEVKLQDTWSDKREIKLWDDSIPQNNYPFVLQDGMTVYFASEGEHSIGGYDLFVTRYNMNNDTYLTPNQLGMPFNSTANDYMLAIDEINNLGYFATDRFQPENKVIIYTFIPNEEMIPINANDNEELIGRAKIVSIKDTWAAGNDYQLQIAQARKNIMEERNKASRDFCFVINDHTIYYSL
ncbi:MAG: tetratricopeptide repeat protein, partial [Dysgonamonadaceae bacterium]|nr:tetratricopeptide repeat protein [Dysgonamonadaceae bacterium]